ncbi:fumarylacetoacetate hydrolase family protein [Mucilaginibacter lacusdianchii]|uniref:fumarylacetoacetate hydrolase family protein n=1 Tax=Mucilaginibacter lacusdianchii TaxID=2684211 RepID=UPI00131C8DCF|nr:fumarylacetoacetate hydrolase family protein [Mucilaginibacter sp. JXJ CY 39]
MTRLLIGLAVGGFLTIINTCPAFCSFLPKWKNTRHHNEVAELLIDTVAEASILKEGGPSIKTTSEALTLSRFDKDGRVHTLAVQEDNGQSVTGIDISAELGRYDTNSFDVIRGMAYEEVVKTISHSHKRISLKYTDLLPSIAGTHHLAIGINYAEHGKETGQVKPFMFPKLLHTDPAIHQLHYNDGWLLDHEVELGIVFPSAVCAAADLNNMLVGFLVVNDFTDRAELMRKMDSQNVTGGKGFPDAKSKKGCLPTGPYLVIPRNWRNFIKELNLQLSVNGVVRQNGYARDMVWDIEKIVDRSLSVKGKTDSYYQNRMIKLFEGNCIPANSIIITGTPAGVVFNAPTKGFIFGSVTKYIFTGGFFHKKMHPYILNEYLKKEMKNTRYLKPGDHIETTISYLGTIKTTIVRDNTKTDQRPASLTRLK